MPPAQPTRSAALGVAKTVLLVALGYGLALFLIQPPSSCAPCAECSKTSSALESSSTNPGSRSLISEQANPGTRVDSRDPKTYNENIQALMEMVSKHAGGDVKKKCLRVIAGEDRSLYSSFSQAGQDWLLFHNYFSHIPYGKGRYLDIGSNHPKVRSNSFFFDRCLGWKGVCIEPNKDYHPLYKEEKRMCELVKSCVASKPMSRSMNFSEGVFGSLQNEGKGEMVECRSLSEVISTFGMDNAEFASIDIEGAEYETLRCFPFRAHGIDTWIVETNKADQRLYRLFQLGGYAPVADVIMGGASLKSDTTRVGIMLDTIFRLVTPPFIFGPDFLPGRPLDGKGPRPACKPDDGFPSKKCPEQLPVILTNEVNKDLTLKDGACGFSKGAYDSEQGAADAVLPTAREPAKAFAA